MIDMNNHFMKTAIGNNGQYGFFDSSWYLFAGCWCRISLLVYFLFSFCQFFFLLLDCSYDKIMSFPVYSWHLLIWATSILICFNSLKNQIINKLVLYPTNLKLTFQLYFQDSLDMRILIQVKKCLSTSII